MRAREPDQSGTLDRDGVKIHYEVFGEGDTTIALDTTFSDHPFEDLEGSHPVSLP